MSILDTQVSSLSNDSPSSTGDDLQVSAELPNAKILLQFLKSISFKENALVIISKNGIRITVEDSKTFQANVFLQREVFSHFLMSDERAEAHFQVKLAPLIDCLGTLSHQQGANPVLGINYSHGQPLKIWIEESGVNVEIHTITRDCGENLDFNFNSSDILCKIIAQAELLKEVVDTDQTSEHVDIVIDPDKELIKFITTGEYGGFETKIPKDSEIITYLSVTRPLHTRYHMPLFIHALRPISMAEKLSLRINKEEVLCVQYMVKHEEGKSFLEFICIPENVHYWDNV